MLITLFLLYDGKNAIFLGILYLRVSEFGTIRILYLRVSEFGTIRILYLRVSEFGTIRILLT